MIKNNKYLEFYGEKGISPVKQDLSDINIHCAKREKLYRQLGIPCIAFEGKKILEVGPGSGYNTLAFLLWGGICTLIEPNSIGVSEMRKLFDTYKISNESYTIEECTIEEADLQEEFDIVIAEGFLPMIDNNREIIKKLSRHVKKGGVIVITCIDSIGLFVEQMKKLACHILLKDTPDYETQVNIATEFFKGQLQHIKGMSRSPEEWVIDNILNPAANTVNLLTIKDALEIFPEQFSFLGSSQRIFTDYSWYKDLFYEEKEELFFQYNIKRHNFMMSGLKETILPEKESEIFEKDIEEVRRYAIDYEKDHSLVFLDQIEKKMAFLKGTASKIDQRCADFIEETIEIISNLKKGNNIEFETYKTFYTSSGRSQQYLSMVRNKVSWR